MRESCCLHECLDLPHKEQQFGPASKPMLRKLPGSQRLPHSPAHRLWKEVVCGPACRDSSQSRPEELGPSFPSSSHCHRWKYPVYARATSYRPRQTHHMHLLSVLCSLTPHWHPELGCAGSIYSTEMGRRYQYKPGNFLK